MITKTITKTQQNTELLQYMIYITTVSSFQPQIIKPAIQNKTPDVGPVLTEQAVNGDCLQVDVDADFKAAVMQYTCVCIQKIKEKYKKNIIQSGTKVLQW